MAIENKEFEKLKKIVSEEDFDVNQTWTGERVRFQTAGNFKDDFEIGTYTPLGYAVCFNKAEAVKILLEAGADPELEYVISGAKRTPLSVAKARNMKMIIKHLNAAIQKKT